MRVQLLWRCVRYLVREGDSYEWHDTRATEFLPAEAYRLARQYGGRVVP